MEYRLEQLEKEFEYHRTRAIEEFMQWVIPNTTTTEREAFLRRFGSGAMPGDEMVIDAMRHRIPAHILIELLKWADPATDRVAKWMREEVQMRAEMSKAFVEYAQGIVQRIQKEKNNGI